MKENHFHQILVRWSLRQIGEEAEITNKRVSPHTFRHTGALMYIMNGGDPFQLTKDSRTFAYEYGSKIYPND